MATMSTARPAGDYNDWLTVQRNVPSDNAAGQPVANWLVKPHARLPAMIVRRGGRERRVFDQMRAEVSCLVRLRVNSISRGIAPADYRFLLDDGTKLNIESRIVDSPPTEYQYECTEVQQ